MIKNMGNIDRMIRILIALLIAVLFFTDKISGTLGIIMLVFAVVFLVTSFIRFCPVYLPFGLKTIKKRKE
jgi:hypothetical protein